MFRGVTSKGKSATFTLVGEAIPTGAGTCLPSPLQCQAVDLKPGETEQFAVQPNGQPVIYELRVLEHRSAEGQDLEREGVRREPRSAAASSGASRASVRNCCARRGLVALPFLRYSSSPACWSSPRRRRRRRTRSLPGLSPDPGK